MPVGRRCHGARDFACRGLVIRRDARPCGRRVASFELKHDELSLYVAAHLEHANYLLAEVAAFVEAHRDPLKRGLLRICRVAEINAEFGNSTLEPERLPAVGSSGDATEGTRRRVDRPTRLGVPLLGNHNDGSAKTRAIDDRTDRPGIASGRKNISGSGPVQRNDGKRICARRHMRVLHHQVVVEVPPEGVYGRRRHRHEYLFAAVRDERVR